MTDEPEGNGQAWQELGKGLDRSSGPDESDPGRPPVKRSHTVSLVLLASAGAAALGLARFDPSQREEDVLVYADPEACIAARVRSEADCRTDYAKAQAAYPTAAPRYATLSACETHHGAGHCVPGETVAQGAAGRFVPRMAAFFLGRAAEQEVDPEAVYEHEPQAASSGGSGGGYCRSSGGRVVTSSGGRSSIARLSSASLHRTSFGGFGSTGRSFTSSGHGFFGGG